MSQPPGYPAQPGGPSGPTGDQPTQASDPLTHHGEPADPTSQPPQPPAPGTVPLVSSTPPAAGTPPSGVPGQPDQYSIPSFDPSPYGPPPTFGGPVTGAPQYGQPTSGAPQYGRPVPGAPTLPAPPYQPTATYQQAPYASPGFATGPTGPAGAPRKSHALLITLVAAVAAVVVLGGAAAFLLLATSEGKGVARPEEAVNQFLTAVYKEKSVTAANRVVCASARDSAAIRKRIAELRAFELKYKSPSYTWPTPTVESRTSESATLTVPVKLTTSDDRVSEQRLKFLTIASDGWLVCEISTA